MLTFGEMSKFHSFHISFINDSTDIEFGHPRISGKPFFWENISARQMYDDHSVYVALHLTLGKLEKPSLDVVKNLDVENWILEPFLC